MEPDDIPVHDLLGLRDAGDAGAPGPDPLRAIVARAGRRRLRITAGGMAVALAIGGVVGYAISDHSSPSAQTATAPPSASPTPAAGGNTASPASGIAGSSGTASGISLPASGGFEHLTRLFTRTTGTVTVRGFLTNFNLPRSALSSCQVSGPAFQAEVSTADMVGVVAGDSMTTRPSATITALESQVVGSAEGDPVTVVTVETAAGVASVHLAFAGGGTDQMAPVKGWAALAAPGSRPASTSTSGASAQSAGNVGVLTAFNASGHQVASLNVSDGIYINGADRTGVASPAIACAPPVCGSATGVSPPRATTGGGTVPATTPATPGAPVIGSGSGSSGSSASRTSPAISSGAPYACPLLAPRPATGSSNGATGAAGAPGAAGSGSSSGTPGTPSTAGSGRATSSAG